MTTNENIDLRTVTAGRWAVVTASGSEYTIDRDKSTLTRHRTEPGNDLSVALRRDDETVDLLEILSCTVGRPAILLIDLHVPGVDYTNRNTTTVVSITELT